MNNVCKRCKKQSNEKYLFADQNIFSNWLCKECYEKEKNKIHKKLTKRK